MGKDLIVECIDKQCSLPILSVVYKDCHIGHNDLKRSGSIPVAVHNNGKLDKSVESTHTISHFPVCICCVVLLIHMI